MTRTGFACKPDREQKCWKTSSYAEASTVGAAHPYMYKKSLLMFEEFMHASTVYISDLCHSLFLQCVLAPFTSTASPYTHSWPFGESVSTATDAANGLCFLVPLMMARHIVLAS